MSPVVNPRAALAHALLTRVAGPEPDEARDRIHLTPGPRWFDPDSPIGRVHGDASMFVGGVGALLLQSLHPLVMTAVADHSGYRQDPWGRLQNTATFIAATTFGTSAAAERAIAIVKAVHKRVVGAMPDGTPYAAGDPHLLSWVHLGEAESFLLAHQHLGRRPLDRAGCDEYVAQTAVVARALGVVDPPVTYAGLRAQLADFRGELAATSAARDVATFLLHTPPLPRAARPGYALITSGALALLPPWARRELGVHAAPVLDPLRRAGGRAVTATIRWALDSAEPGRAPEAVDAAR
ncbi:oxygenase MpaB family protein [Cellulomonas sp. NTE-D12]|uniref:oxygenase MpaB family protein n=1 Tax=Cellulomonas sp. NTE-D12 TaxID=2962632 RepID=UPI00308216A0